MKKIIFLLIITFGAFCAQAQEFTAEMLYIDNYSTPMYPQGSIGVPIAKVALSATDSGRLRNIKFQEVDALNVDSVFYNIRLMGDSGQIGQIINQSIGGFIPFLGLNHPFISDTLFMIADVLMSAPLGYAAFDVTNAAADDFLTNDPLLFLPPIAGSGKTIEIVAATGIEMPHIMNLSVNQFQVSLSQGGAYGIEVFTTTGQKVWSTIAKGNSVVDLSHIPKGMALIRISNSKGVLKTFKVEIQ